MLVENVLLVSFITADGMLELAKPYKLPAHKAPPCEALLLVNRDAMMKADCLACDILPLNETAPPELPAQQITVVVTCCCAKGVWRQVDTNNMTTCK